MRYKCNCLHESSWLGITWSPGEFPNRNVEEYEDDEVEWVPVDWTYQNWIYDMCTLFGR